LEVADLVKSGANLATIVTNWRGGIVHDGSIHGGSPFEINTAPAQGDTFLTQVKEITDELKEIGAVANDSCGYHIHVDARDYTFFDVRKLIFLYDKLEDTLFDLMPDVRRNNTRYCARTAKKYIKDLEKFAVPQENGKKIVENVYGVKNQSLASVRGEKYHNARYGALNIHSYIFRGTFECRLFEGTVSYENITNWAMLWASIIDYAFEMSEKEIKNMKGEGFMILHSIAPNKTVKDWLIERKKKFGDK
jgi:hypothetical protein